MQFHRFFSQYGCYIPSLGFFRYVFVGSVLNLIGYLFYLVLTTIWLSPFATITIFYLLGIIAGYFAHKRYTFREREQKLRGFQFIQFVAVYFLGYLLNWLLLFVFTEKLSYPHQVVQLLSIFVVAGLIFISLRIFVFSSLSHEARKNL